MDALAQHLVLRLRDNRVIVPTVADRRYLARAIFERAREYALLAFRAADTHIHLAAACSRLAAGQLARRIEISSTRTLRLAVGFAPAHIEPMRTQRHLRNTFFYILRQHQHHGIDTDPFHEGSNLPDLLGLRRIGVYSAENVRALLPRVRRADLLEVLGVATLDRPAELTLERLAAATAAAAALPDLSGCAAETNAARRAAIALAGRTFSSIQLSRALCTSRSTVNRMRHQPPCDQLVQAIRLQHRLRATLVPTRSDTRPPPDSDFAR